MYGKAPKMTDSKKTKKAMPMAVMVTAGKTKPMPVRGQRTATNKMTKKAK
jgi:ribosomal protein S13